MAVGRGATLSHSVPLFRRFPELGESLPFISLSSGPSPVARLDRLRARIPGGEIWVKNDGLYGTIYGGNKPRKLEFVLAEAQARGAHTILTTGALGTNHGLATAHYGRQLGLRVVLLLTYEEPSRAVADQLCRMHQAGARLHYTRSLPLTALLTPYFMLRFASRRPWRWPYLLPPGGSSPLGALGHVNAALELAEQVKRGDLPEPQAVVVPLGSGGTAAGLLLGLRLAGLKSQLLAVAVSRAPTAWAATVTGLANAAARRLSRQGIRQPLPSFLASDIEVLKDWLGPGYGRASRAGEAAKALLEETEGLALDSVYTAKTVAALLALRSQGALEGPLLYWHTHNALPLPELPAAYSISLPPPLRRFCQP